MNLFVCHVVQNDRHSLDQVVRSVHVEIEAVDIFQYLW